MLYYYPKMTIILRKNKMKDDNYYKRWGVSNY